MVIELAPVIRESVAGTKERSGVEIAVLVVGTDKDPQDLEGQIEQLEAAGAAVFRNTAELIAFVAERFTGEVSPRPHGVALSQGVALEDLEAVSCINVGLEHFRDSLAVQEVRVVHVDWRPPAGGSDKLQAILAKIG